MSIDGGGFSPWGSWEDFSATVNQQGFAWQNLVGQDKGVVWTPALKFGALTVGITYANQLGRAIRLGPLVIAGYFISLSSKGGLTGNAIITGLPFGSVSGAARITMAGSWSGMTSTLVYMAAIPDAADRTASIYGATGATATLSPLNGNDFADNTAIRGALMYLIS